MKHNRSPVAKNMHKFTKPATHRDKTKYRRKEKHTKKGSQGPFYLAVGSVYWNKYINNKDPNNEN